MPRSAELARTGDLLTWAEVATILGVSTRTVQGLKSRGEIGFVTRGTGPRPRVYFTRDHVDTYLRKVTREQKASA